METIRTKGFTAKDLFNATSATPVKEAKGNSINVVAVCTAVNAEGQNVGYIKADDNLIYATISTTIIDQLQPLSEMIEEDGTQTVTVIAKVSNSGNEYFLLELQ